MSTTRVRSSVEHWPVVTLDINASPMLDQDFERMFDAMTRVLKRERRFTLIIDARGSSSKLTGSVRTVIQSALSKIYEDLGRYQVATAIVLESAYAKGLMTSVLWILQQLGDRDQHNYAVFATYGEAAKWAVAQLIEAGITESSERASLLRGVTGGSSPTASP